MCVYKVPYGQLDDIKKHLVKTNKALAKFVETPELKKIIKGNDKQIKFINDNYLEIKAYYE